MLSILERSAGDNGDVEAGYDLDESIARLALPASPATAVITRRDGLCSVRVGRVSLTICLLGFSGFVALLIGLPRQTLFCSLVLTAIAAFAGGKVFLRLGFVLRLR